MIYEGIITVENGLRHARITKPCLSIEQQFASEIMT
jgi:hypothetical protein